MMAATGGNTGVVKPVSRGSSTGLQSDQERMSFGDVCTVVKIPQNIPSQSLRALESTKLTTPTFLHHLRTLFH